MVIKIIIPNLFSLISVKNQITYHDDTDQELLQDKILKLIDASTKLNNFYNLITTINFFIIALIIINKN